MKRQLLSHYRKITEQVWIPIFGQDEFDTETLLEGCRLAGICVLEYTLRRKDAKDVLPTLKKRFPQAVILMGSTLDDERIVHQMKEKHPQLMTLSELEDFVDGFVSMLPFSDNTLQQYRDTHILIPTAETGGEALRQMKSGATFIKVLGPDLSFSKRLHALPTFGCLPTYITGGITTERMKEAFEAGNLLCAAGFDVVLKGEDPKSITAETVAKKITSFVETAKKERACVLPQLEQAKNLSDDEFFAALPNFCSVR